MEMEIHFVNCHNLNTIIHKRTRLRHQNWLYFFYVEEFKTYHCLQISTASSLKLESVSTELDMQPKKNHFPFTCAHFQLEINSLEMALCIHNNIVKRRNRRKSMRCCININQLHHRQVNYAVDVDHLLWG